jgi:multisite-specific tRNA:(cytosine-C5)-methyltransferase
VDDEPDETAMEEDTEVILDESKAESADASAENPHSEDNMKPTPKTLTKKGKNKSGQGGGSFKENPYTFLSPDDPILLSCM